MEDDIVLDREPKKEDLYELFYVLNDVHLVFLFGLIHNSFDCTIKIEELKKYNEQYLYVDPSQHAKALGLQCYVINPNMAQILINDFFPITTHVDYYIANKMHNMKHKYCVINNKSRWLRHNYNDAIIIGLTTHHKQPDKESNIEIINTNNIFLILLVLLIIIYKSYKYF